MFLSIRRFIIAIAFLAFSWLALTTIHKRLDPNTSISEEEEEDARWVATSKWFLDRQCCRFLGLCGLAHYHVDPAWPKRRRTGVKGARSKRDVQKPLLEETEAQADVDADALWMDFGGQADKNMKPDDLAGERQLREIPQYVLDAAPLIHLYSKEEFWPSDIAEHVTQTSPHENHTSLNMNTTQHTLDNLHNLNSDYKGRLLYMQSKEDVESRPIWLGSAYNKPNPFPESDKPEDAESLSTSWVESEVDDQAEWFDPRGPSIAVPLDSDGQRKDAPPRVPLRGETARPLLRRRRCPTSSEPCDPPHRRRRDTTTGPPSQSGYSPAPATLILVDKGHDIIDAFWFYFYSYNLGTTVLNIRFGNHVGDWEHSLIRFYKGVPKAVFFSAHSGGNGYHFKAVEKGVGKGREGRPVLYSALGSHAMYATPGTHPYVLPFNLLADVTDKGPLWDPALNYRGYFYNTSITHDLDARAANSSPVSIAAYMSERFAPAAQNPDAPTSWFWYTGHWGDKFYELSDWRQWRFVGQYHYVNGPFGPRSKNLGRSRVCQSGRGCRLLDRLTGKTTWIGRRRR